MMLESDFSTKHNIYMEHNIFVDAINSLSYKKREGNYRLSVDFRLNAEESIDELSDLKVIFFGSENFTDTAGLKTKDPYKKYNSSIDVESQYQRPAIDVSIVSIKNGIDVEKLFFEDF